MVHRHLGESIEWPRTFRGCRSLYRALLRHWQHTVPSVCCQQYAGRVLAIHQLKQHRLQHDLSPPMSGYETADCVAAFPSPSTQRKG
jgi:hypothetical protein